MSPHTASPGRASSSPVLRQPEGRAGLYFSGAVLGRAETAEESGDFFPEDPPDIGVFLRFQQRRARLVEDLRELFVILFREYSADVRFLSVLLRDRPLSETPLSAPLVPPEVFPTDIGLRHTA